MEEIKPLPTPEFLFKDNANIVKNYGFTDSGGWAPPIINVHGPEEGGIWSYHQGEKFPRKILMWKEARMMKEALNRIVILTIRYFPFILIFKTRCMKVFAEYTEMLTRYWIGEFDTDKFCTFGREVYRVGIEMSDGVRWKQWFVYGVCWMLEFDDAYRYFIQDLFGYFDKESFLKNPRKELKRIFDIAETKGEGTRAKFHYFGISVPWTLLFGETRRTAIKFIEKLNIEKCTLDKYDWYHCLRWSAWEFGGIPLKSRMILRQAVDANMKEYDEVYEWIRNTAYKDKERG